MCDLFKKMVISKKIISDGNCVIWNIGSNETDNFKTEKIEL